jgi:sugar phosphate isomerase/epimerase
MLLVAIQCYAADPPPPVQGYPIGWCIRARPEVYAQAKTLGYEFVELALQDVLNLSDDDFDKRRAEFDAVGLPALVGYNSIPRDLKLVGPDIDQARQDAHLRKMLTRAAALKLSYLVLNAGGSWRVPDGFDARQAFTQLADFSRRFATQAAAHNITVLVQPLRSSDSNQITTIGEAIKLIETVNHANFALLVDYSFLVIQKDDLEALTKSPAALRHVWISNPAKNRTYATSDDESDYGAFFGVLKRIGYKGGLSVHGGSQDIPNDAPRAIAFLRRKAQQLQAR